MDPEPVLPPKESTEEPLEELVDYSSVGRAITVRKAAGKPIKLFQLSILLLAILIVYMAATAKVADQVHLFLGLAMIVLGFLHVLIWIKNAQFGLPIFETFMATTVSAYALPLVRSEE